MDLLLVFFRESSGIDYHYPTYYGDVAQAVVGVSVLIWLASMGGGNGYEGIDTWPMMP